MNEAHFGYYDDPDSAEPTFDPGLDIPCPDRRAGRAMAMTHRIDQAIEEIAIATNNHCACGYSHAGEAFLQKLRTILTKLVEETEQEQQGLVEFVLRKGGESIARVLGMPYEYEEPSNIRAVATQVIAAYRRHQKAGQ